jgi:hypothetical protein
MYLKEIRWDGVTGLIWHHWRSVVNTAMDIWFTERRVFSRIAARLLGSQNPFCFIKSLRYSSSCTLAVSVTVSHKPTRQTAITRRSVWQRLAS